MTKLYPPALTKLLTNLPPGAKIELIKLPSGEIAVTNTDTPPKTKDQLLNEPEFRPLKGQGITLTEAAEKYRVPRHAIRDWVYQAKYIQFVDTVSYPQKIDEAEVALCAKIYRERKNAGGLTGLPFFDKAGYEIKGIKHPDLSAKRRRQKEAA